MTEPKWLTIARGELGVREYSAFRPGPAGVSSNPRIEEYQRAANGREDDDVPWCSSFVCWCMEQAGLPGTGRGAARSWLRWGVSLSVPVPGCVVVLWRESRESYKGHVGIYERPGPMPDSVVLLGGNQANAVRTASFPTSRVLAYRWPSEAMLAAMPAIH
jgi:uncharacterized protein (TIGR02594 family)